MAFKKHPLLYILLPICAIAILASFYRFMVVGDYIVEYEGACDPSIESCFVCCTDEECSETYFYTMVQKSASDVRAQCGSDITDCEEANVCLAGDMNCVVTYCSADTVGENEACVSPSSIPTDTELDVEQDEERVDDEPIDESVL